MKILPTWFHGILDYIVGIALFFAPVIFGFTDVGGAAVFLPKILGIGLIVYSILTRYELGFIRVIPMKVHLIFDFVASALLALSPWIFGFSGEAMNAWLPHVVVGIVVIIVVLISESHSPVEDKRS